MAEFRPFDYAQAVGAGQRNALAGIQLQQARQQMQDYPQMQQNALAGQSLDLESKRLAYMAKSLPMVDANNYQDWRQASIRNKSLPQGIVPPPQYDPNWIAQATGAAQQKVQKQFGGQQTFKDEAGNMYFGTTRRNPQTGDVQSVLAPIGGGPATPQGRVSLVSDLGLTAAERVAQKGAEAGAKETAKLTSQRKLKPEVEAAVTTAVETAKAKIEAAGAEKSNATALDMYDTAMSGLTTALGGTTTGPGVGWLPAVTANQQIADGAIAAMAPILKQLFRTAGEGTFTDKDQELLLQMVPTRSDYTEARQAKIQNIDAIVRAKLGQPSASVARPVQHSGQPTIPRGTAVQQGGIKFLGFE